MVSVLEKGNINEEDPVVIGWDEASEHLEKIGAINILKIEIVKRICVLPVKVRLKVRMRIYEGWAFLNHSKCCIVVFFRKHMANTQYNNGSVDISMWKTIFVFRNNQYFDEVAVFPDRPMLFEWQTMTLLPFEENDR